jgi:hypothetical protein
MLAVGCRSFLPEWPPYQDTVQEGQGAVLFQISEDVRLSDDFGINSVMVRWPDKNQPGPDDWARSQHFRVPLDEMVNHVTSTVLIALTPDSYPHTVVRVLFAGYQIHYIDLEPDKPLDFTVRPGEVTVLGRLHVAANVETTEEGTDQRDYSQAAHLVLDDSRKTKLAVLNDALARPEATAFAWHDALESARRRLIEK